MIDEETDMRLRMMPAPVVVVQAVALLKAERLADMVVIPMCFPGKERHWWKVGQEVRTVHGVLFLAVNSFNPGGFLPSVSWARDAASRMAKEFLDERGGTVGWAYVHRDGTWSVSEDIL